MPATSDVEPETIRAYEETHYWVEAPDPFRFEVGQYSQPLAALHHSHGVRSSAFIAAFNPYSKRCNEAENLRRQAALAEELRALGRPFLAGMGKHPSGHWPGEASFLVLGLSQPRARALGERHEQNALIWIDDSAVPRLMLLR